MKPAKRYPGRFAGPSRAVSQQCADNARKTGEYDWAALVLARHHAEKEARK